MGRAKEIIVKVIPSKIANEFVKKHHYSKAVMASSKIHFGCFLDNILHGVLSYGSCIDIRKTLPLVQPCLWNDFLELNRMAFDEVLPKNSESRCISISIKLIKKNAPNIKWIISFADGTQCGDGSIYRASGFVLTGIKKNSQILKMPDGKLVTKKTLDSPRYTTSNGKYGSSLAKENGATLLPGFQLRYIYLIDKSCKITVPILPFSEIERRGAGMYKGIKKQHAAIAQGSAPGDQPGDGSRPDLAAQK